MKKSSFLWQKIYFLLKKKKREGRRRYNVLTWASVSQRDGTTAVVITCKSLAPKETQEGKSTTGNPFCVERLDVHVKLRTKKSERKISECCDSGQRDRKHHKHVIVQRLLWEFVMLAYIHKFQNLTLYATCASCIRKMLLRRCKHKEENFVLRLRHKRKHGARVYLAATAPRLLYNDKIPRGVSLGYLCITFNHRILFFSFLFFLFILMWWDQWLNIL